MHGSGDASLCKGASRQEPMSRQRLLLVSYGNVGNFFA